MNSAATGYVSCYADNLSSAKFIGNLRVYMWFNKISVICNCFPWFHSTQYGKGMKLKSIEII